MCASTGLIHVIGCVQLNRKLGHCRACNRLEALSLWKAVSACCLVFSGPFAVESASQTVLDSQSSPWGCMSLWAIRSIGGRQPPHSLGSSDPLSHYRLWAVIRKHSVRTRSYRVVRWWSSPLLTSTFLVNAYYLRCGNWERQTDFGGSCLLVKHWRLLRGTQRLQLRTRRNSLIRSWWRMTQDCLP
jgi:hypothetical protein